MNMGEPEITPTELKFRFQIGKQLPTTITVHNPSSKRLAFKVKTTTPKKYVVRPSAGIVEPSTTSSVQVIMQAQKEFPPDFNNCKDKFLVQTLFLEPGEEPGQDTFKKESRKDIRETRLKVILDGPPAPPSPVPEANETEEDVSTMTRSLPRDVEVEDANESARSRTVDNSAILTAENKKLKENYERLRIERDALKKKLDELQLQLSNGGDWPQKGAQAQKFAIWPIIIVAVLAFFLGHFY